MHPYLKNADNEEEFNDILDAAMMLFSARKKRRELAEKELIKLGAKAVRPLACAIELALWDRSLDDWDIDERADIVSEVILKIGKNVLPDLEDFATNGSCNIFVNEWAQEMIFKIMGLEGEERQKVCHHFGFLLIPDENKNLRVCPLCKAEFLEHENKIETEEK